MTSSVRVLYSGVKHEVSILPSQTIQDLKQTILSSCPSIVEGASSPTQFKLVLSGRLLKDDEPIEKLKFDRLSAITLLYSSGKEVGRTVIPRHLQVRVIDDLSSAASSSSSSSSSSASTTLSPQSRFGRVMVLPDLSLSERASQILHELANDPGYIAVMEKHDWRVGALCELFPDGQVGVDPVCVLGLNENHGQRILLRIRTDDLLGFRSMISIRQTLSHELAHNVHGDHNDDFYRLMRQVEREVVSLDWRNSTAHVVGSGGGGSRLEGRAQGVIAAAPPKMVDSSHLNLANSVKPAAVPPVPTPDPESERACGCGRTHLATDFLQCEECLPCPPPPAPPPTCPPVLLVAESVPFPASELTTSRDAVQQEEADDSSQYCDWQMVSESVLSGLDEAIALCLASESGSTPIEQLFQLRESLQLILSQGSNEDGQRQRIVQGLITLRLILGNCKELDDPKYKTVNTSGTVWRNKVAMIRGASEVLSVAGFYANSSQTALVYSRGDLGLLYLVFEFVDTVVRTLDSQLCAV